MRPIAGDIFIAAPAETVFDFAADQSNEPLYNRNMLRAEKLTPGPVRAGTRFSAVMGDRRRTAVTVECTGFDRPRRLASLSRTTGMDIEGDVTFAPEGNGTRLRWVWTLHPRGLLRLLTPAVRMMGIRQERANWTALKSYVEGHS